MRAILIVSLMFLSASVPAAQVSINCADMPVDAVIADLARQSGAAITLAAPSDVRVTAKLSDVPLEESLKVVSRLCGGVFTRGESGYVVYPRTSPDHVLGLIRGMYSKIKSIEVVVKRKAEPNSAGVQVLTSRQLWKSTGKSRYESERISRGRLVKDFTVEDGQWKWMPRPEAGRVEKYKSTEPRHISLVTARSQWALPFLAKLDAAALPSLTCTGAEERNGRAVYVMEYDASSSESYRPPETGQWAPPLGQPGMYPSSGSLRLSARGLMMEYVFSRPSPLLDPPVVRKSRFGVDGETGMLAFDTVVTPSDSYEIETIDIREVAPGIHLPFETRRAGSGKTNRDADAPEIEIRVNADLDDSLFEYAPPPDLFVMEYPNDLEACEAALKEKPGDPDLLYKHAQLTAVRGSEFRVAALRDYERALAAKPKARPYLLTAMLSLASQLESPEVALKYIAEIRKTMPDDRDASFVIARAYQSLGMDAEALEEFGKLCASAEKRAEAPLSEVAALCEKTGDKARAERIYLEVLGIADANQCQHAAQSLQTMYSSEKRLDALREPLKAATDRFPEASGLLVTYGLLLSKLNEPDAAMGVFRRVAKGKSEYDVCGAMRELKSVKNYKGAKEIAETYMSQPTDSSQPTQRRGNSQILSELSDIYVADGITIAKAVEVYRKFTQPRGSLPMYDDARSSTRQTVRRILAQTKVLSEAVQVVNRMWKANKLDTDLAYLLIELAASSSYGGEEPETALCAAAIRDLIAAWPGEPALYAMLGEIHVKSGDYSEAAKAFRKGMELSPNQPYYYTALANVYSRANEHDRALDLLRRLLERAPANDLFYAALGVGYANAGEWQDAITQFRKVDEIEQARPREYQSITLDALIRCYEKLSDLTSIEQCLLQKVDRANVDWQRSGAVRGLAEFYVKNGQMDKAVAQIVQLEEVGSKQNADSTIQSFRWSTPQEKRKELSTALASSLAGKPELVSCRLLLVDLYTELQDVSAAMPILDDLIARSWDDPVRLGRVRQSVSSGQAYRQLSVKVLERLIVLEPNKLWHVVSLMRDLSGIGLKDKAIALAQRLMRYARGEMSMPDDAGTKPEELATSCADLFLQLNMYDEALAACDLALQLRPENADDYRGRIARIYVQSGDLTSALSAYAELAETARDESRKTNALRESAYIYERQQNKDEAVKCWRKLLSMATNDYAKKEAQRQIDRLTAPPPEPRPQ